MKTQICRYCGREYPRGNGYHREICGACYIKRLRKRRKTLIYKIFHSKFTIKLPFFKKVLNVYINL
jgi:hypothetical protein